MTTCWKRFDERHLRPIMASQRRANTNSQISETKGSQKWYKMQESHNRGILPPCEIWLIIRRMNGRGTSQRLAAIVPTR